MTVVSLKEFAAQRGEARVAGVEIVERPGELSAIKRPNVAAVVWRRAPLERFQGWIDALEPERLPSLRSVMGPGAARAAVQAACEAAGTPASPEREQLVGDIAALSDAFRGVTGAPFQRLRLDVVSGDACRKFHVDSLFIRLVCTYRGPGTQYGAARPEGDPSPILDTPNGSPLLMRGSRWPAPAAPKLLHRSPPIAGSGLTRLVLVIDPIFDPEDEV